MGVRCFGHRCPVFCRWVSGVLVTGVRCSFVITGHGCPVIVVIHRTWVSGVLWVIHSLYRQFRLHSAGRIPSRARTGRLRSVDVDAVGDVVGHDQAVDIGPASTSARGRAAGDALDQAVPLPQRLEVPADCAFGQPRVPGEDLLARVDPRPVSCRVRRQQQSERFGLPGDGQHPEGLLPLEAADRLELVWRTLCPRVGTHSPYRATLTKTPRRFFTQRIGRSSPRPVSCRSSSAARAAQRRH